MTQSPRPSGFLTTEDMFFTLYQAWQSGPHLQWTRSCLKKIENDYTIGARVSNANPQAYSSSLTASRGTDAGNRGQREGVRRGQSPEQTPAHLTYYALYHATSIKKRLFLILILKNSVKMNLQQNHCFELSKYKMCNLFLSILAFRFSHFFGNYTVP